MDPNNIDMNPVPEGTPTDAAPAADSQAAAVAEKTGAEKQWIDPNQVTPMATNATRMGGKATLWYTVAGVIFALFIVLAGSWYFFYVKGAANKGGNQAAINGELNGKKLKFTDDCSKAITDNLVTGEVTANEAGTNLNTKYVNLPIFSGKPSYHFESNGVVDNKYLQFCYVKGNDISDKMISVSLATSVSNDNHNPEAFLGDSNYQLKFNSVSDVVTSEEKWDSDYKALTDKFTQDNKLYCGLGSTDWVCHYYVVNSDKSGFLDYSFSFENANVDSEMKEYSKSRLIEIYNGLLKGKISAIKEG